MKHLKKMCAALCALCCAASLVIAESASKDAQDGKKSQPLFKRLELSVSSSLRVPFENGEDAALGLKGGARASFLDCDLRLYGSIPVTKFSESGGVLGFVKNADGPRYGASFSFSRFVKFPLTAKAGSLSLGGTFSRLRKPAFSTSTSPFLKSLSTKTGVSASLPSLNSGKKEFSASLDLRVPKAWRTFEGSGAAFFYRVDGTFAASADFLINFSSMTKAGVSFTGTRFYLENKSKSWFSPQGFFKPGWFGAFSLQAFFSAPAFTTLLTCNAYMQPIFPLRYTFASESRLSLGKFNLLFSAFAVDPRAFASSERGIMLDGGSALDTLAQLKVTPQYTWRFASARLPSLTVGASAMAQYKEKNAERRGEAKYSVGAKYADRFFSAQISFEADGFTFTEGGADAKNASRKISAKFSRAKGTVKPGAEASCAFKTTESKKGGEILNTTETCKLSISAGGKNLSASGSADVTLKQKNGDFSGGTLTLGFSASHTTKFIKCSFKFEARGTWN